MMAMTAAWSVVASALVAEGLHVAEEVVLLPLQGPRFLALPPRRLLPLRIKVMTRKSQIREDKMTPLPKIRERFLSISWS